MKLFILAALCAVVYSRTVEDNNSWPWQVGKEYRYNFDSQTSSEFDTSAHVGSAFKAQFIVKVKEPGHLVAKLENPQYAQFHDDVEGDELPSDINYEPYHGIDQVFEIFISNNRINEIKVPKSLSIPHENFLKGLLGALQVDLSDGNYVPDFTNNYNKELYQGLFKKYESDVTGECETLYTVAPPSVQWRSQIPDFATVEEPIEVTKIKNYGVCLKRSAYSFGVPVGAVWQGVAKDIEENQFIKHTASAYLLVGKQGPIYQSELNSNVAVSPMLFGEQKSRVFSHVRLLLTAVKDNYSNWPISQKTRVVKSLLYTKIDQQFRSESTDEDVTKIQALLQEIAPLMLKPNDLPKSEFLSKFNILVYLISNLNSEQLTHITSGIKIAKSSRNLAKRNVWLVYRDAVAQAGSVAAFREVKSWILTKKIENHVAAEVIATVAGALFTRTFEFESEFFELAFNPVVTEQKYLNTSAVLAATKYVRLSNNSAFIADVVVPRLGIELKQSVESGDSSKSLVYIKSLGNLAHPEILKAFAPYIGGKIPISKFLRLQMVLNLKTLANNKDEKVRAVLFSILRNTAEDTDVRVAAVLNIFLAFPTTEMMELMAMLSNRDPSTEVRAAITTSINFAAELTDPRFAELAKAAQSVLNIVSTKNYGNRMSTDSLRDYISSDEIASFEELSFISSATTILPIYQRAALRLKSTSQTEEDLVSYSVSDMRQLISHFLSPKLGPAAKTNFKFTPKQIAEKLNIKGPRFAPLEGSFFADDGYLQEFFTFTENTEDFSLFVKDVYKYLLKLEFDNLIPTSYTKMGIQKEVQVTFPLISGQPFVFKYSEPFAVITNFHTPKTSRPHTAQQEYELIYARNIDGNVGYWDVLGDFYATSGLMNKLQFHIPMKFTIDFSKLTDVLIKFELPEEDTTLVHYSVWPYTTVQKTKDLKAASENPATKLVEGETKVAGAELPFGDDVGTVFVLEGYSYSSDYTDYSHLFETDWITNIRNLLYQNDVALTKLELKFKAKDSVNKAVTFRLFLSKLINQQFTESWGPPTPIEDLKPKSVKRITEIVKRAAAGISNAKVNLVDFSISFTGRKPVHYVFTAAVADSFVDRKLQAAFVLGGPGQINAVFKVVKPKVQVLDIVKAIKNDITVSYEAYLKIGNESVHYTGIGERTEQFKDGLLNSDVADICLKDNSNNNFYQMPCHKLLILIHTPDKFNVTFKYEPRLTFSDASSFFTNIFQMLFTYEKETFIPMPHAEGIMEIEALMDYEQETFDLSNKFQQGSFIFKNVEGAFFFPYAFSFYAPINSWERSRNCLTNYQHMPFCAVDGSQVKTFSGRTYDYELTNSWHVLMVDEYNHYGQNYDLVMLAKKPGNNQAELYISYKDPSGKYLELEVKPDNVAARTNARKVGEGALTSYWNELTELPFFEYYSIDDATVFDVNNGGLRVIYDKERFVVFTDDHRNSTRGICGHSSMQISDDFLTPWGRVERPDYFGASYSLTTEGSDPKTEQLKKEAKTHAFVPVTKFTWIGY